MLPLAACETFGPAAVHAAVTLCIEAIMSLLDAPRDTLPVGYARCASTNWQVRDQSLEFCFYCKPGAPELTYVQFDCEGPYYPLRMRRVGRRTDDMSTSADGGVSIKKVSCEEHFLVAAEINCAPALGFAATSFRSPNDRLLPDRAGHKSLTVTIDGADAPADGDFVVRTGSRIVISGTLDEVAHYAMTAGVSEFSFLSGGSRWEVFANPEVSAAMVFRDGVLWEKRILFAPEAP